MKVGRLRKFIKLSYKDKLLVAYIFILCGIVRLTILIVPFSIIRRHLGKYNIQSDKEVIEKENYQLAHKVQRLVTATARYTPWQSKCLVQAIVAQHLLKKYHLGTTIYFGIAKDESGKILAHAWLRYGSMVVTGGGAVEYFKMVACYCNELTI